MLTLTGAGPVTVTNLKGGLNATGDSGLLTVTATGATGQSIAIGSGATTITDSAAGGGVTVDATGLGAGTLTLAGSAAKMVNSLRRQSRCEWRGRNDGERDGFRDPICDHGHGQHVDCRERERGKCQRQRGRRGQDV